MALINLRVCQEFHMFDASITDRVFLKGTHLAKKNDFNLCCLYIFELCSTSHQLFLFVICALYIVLVLTLSYF